MQGDPLAMPMYSIATIPLIKKLKGHSKQIWYADDAAAVGKTADLRAWWDQLTREGPDFGYYPNPTKTWLVTKEGCQAAGLSTFAGTGVNVTPDGIQLMSITGYEAYVCVYRSEVPESGYTILFVQPRGVK